MSRREQFETGADPVRFLHYSLDDIGITGVQAYRGPDPVAGQYLGGAFYRVRDDHTEIPSITVEKEHQRQGIGSGLLHEIESHTGKPVRIGSGRNTKAGKSLFAKHRP